MVTHAQEIETALNLKRQLKVLDTISDSDMIFQDTSPPKRWDTVYSVESGEPIRVARHRLISVLEKRLPDGRPMFTADQSSVPQYVLGDTLCFLAKGSDQREDVDRLNISPGYYCPARHLANESAADVHAMKRHPQRYRQYKEHLARKEREEDRARQEAQTAAILELARARGPGRPRKDEG